MSILDFIAEVKQRGMARTNRYLVEFQFPNSSGDTANLVSLFCEAVNLPGINVESTAAKVFGETREMPYNRTFDPVTFTFYVDSDMEVKAAFERWVMLVVNQNSRTVNYYNNYIKDVYISVLDIEDNMKYTLTLHEAYPKTMAAVGLDAGAKDVMRVSVTMQYKYWTSDASENVDNKTTLTDNLYALQDPMGYFTDTGYSYEQSQETEDTSWPWE